jgi:hypothetical protein
VEVFEPASTRVVFHITQFKYTLEDAFNVADYIEQTGMIINKWEKIWKEAAVV